MSSSFFDLDVKKSYPKLYSRDTKGKIRVWWMDQDNAKYRMLSGVENGAVVDSTWTTAEAKNVGQVNETTSVDQATKEIQAKYKKQRESGYFDDVKDVDNFQFFQPMLAHKWVEHKEKVDWSKGAYISPKLDGVRCVLTKDGAFSRNGKRFISFPHISRELKKMFADDPNLVLDGEIYTHKLNQNFDKIISLARKTKPTTDDVKEAEALQYWIFDCPTLPGGFHDRYTALKKMILANYRDNPWIRVCIHTLIKNEADIEPALQDWLTHGFEGLMLNTYDGQYEKKRSYYLLKYKQFFDEDYEIVDIEEGVGNRSKMMGAVILRDKNDKVFKANARGDQAYYTKLLREKEDLKGLTATVKYQNLTPDGVPRFGVVVAIRDYE